jgi:hypothetical protein
MTSVGTISLKQIWAMLDHCAPGHTRSAKLHHWWITFGEKTYRSLPLGRHGRRANPEIEVGHVRKMVRHLSVSDCAAKFLNW